ncbi:D-hexose-6-phosphate mutarotase [Thiomicrorhabdus lithotrophica]|uniref:Putative glucose-6-phosphate 1-epimerase n=1 Tax=Thiomicrorhabdus lithotrophica TaxID=2949997 RepID=A0ABY8C9H9_9GAMM|nr:D-hexose-6-phosphate mutarotase [Thiomicrorhabdus lithotrophica]WEJ62584.1 D-hexose-6-phosphate mutarotase [Thiomicrorhabdus lithotrophica]
MATTYQEQFSVDGIQFTTREAVELIEIDNQFAKATITTMGGSVLSFIPKGQKDLLWVSDSAIYDGSKPIRGGVPICWPWFGGAKQPGLPAHGFVRSMVWTVEKAAHLDTGETRVLLACESNEKTLEQWPHVFKLKLCVEVGASLTLTLISANLSDESVDITEALHTYFSVANPIGMQIKGLEQSTHLDKLVDNAPAEIQTDVVVLNPPKDSVYLNQTGTVSIVDADNERQIVIHKRNSQSSVVWNPGPEIVKGFADIDDQAWLDFACVESGNVLEDFITLPAKAEHMLSVQYLVKPL